ncbi:alpha/beta fold hydrolase [Herbidospora sp. NEAU-GS84]|uniref:Alpha/beta fold hydrolase n=1 Tax=Herbidospora solisilvae TaxID=2696284 RepID=A0A7C9J7D4_9ACTN|nr:alpha/beta fold hydrolase [Herbidospora solisilvae]NAS26425.1 alpha/beta fold hydrolase [Herbidospora solisilvae]
MTINQGVRRVATWAATLAVVLTAGAGLTAAPAAADISPLGANIWTCEPSPLRPRPVVLVHGTFEDMAGNWATLSPRLKLAGHCVFALNYGRVPATGPVHGVGDISRSAQELSDFVDRVLAATGASEVDVVGHSQGGMMPRYYLKFLNGAAKVHRLIGVTPSNHGTSSSGLVDLARLLGLSPAVALVCQACQQQMAGSDFMKTLNDGGDTVPGVDYTVIATRFDRVVTPYTSSFLTGDAVRNILLQDRAPLDFSGHAAVNHDPVVHQIVLDELDAPATPLP